MKVFTKDNFEKVNTGCVLAFGNFDGVHNGHKHLLLSAKKYAEDNGLAFGVYSFSDSPKFVNAKHSILTTLQMRLSLVEESVSPDFVYLENFDVVKDKSPESFVEYIIDNFCCECGFCGDNFRFGKNASGTSDLLVELMNNKGKDAAVVQSVLYDGTVVSSSRICSLLAEGKVDVVRKMGVNFGFVSKVVHGAHLGNKLGFPTINQTVPNELICPKFGVYATVAVVDGREYMGVTNFGVKPTVSNDNVPVAETYIIDFDGEVYGKDVGIQFVERLRDEKTFSSLDELRKNIAYNVAQTRKIFEEKYENN